MFGIVSLLFFAAILRVFLMFYGTFHDHYFNVKFTDVDYSVFSDAAAHVFHNRSPYDRDTYRYTPLLSWILVPTVYWAPFGKVLFNACDLLVAILIYKLLCNQRPPVRNKKRSTSSASLEKNTFAVQAAAIWLLNPVTAIVSSRGNAESLQALLVLASLALLQRVTDSPSLLRTALAALIHGFAIHFKLYPVIYLPSVVLYLSFVSLRLGDVSLRTLICNCINRLTLTYAFVVTFVFGAFGVFFYRVYGWTFVYETYLYHLARRDAQHNFSPHFYPLYLASGNEFAESVIGVIAFAVQAFSVAHQSLDTFSDLPLCWFLVTAYFVTLNKVCTSQYFLWYLCLLPLLWPRLRAAGDLRLLARLLVVWLAAQGVWLACAYVLEFQRVESVRPLVWLASVNFLLCNLYVLQRLKRAYIRGGAVDKTA